jgi:hypothetical protein
MKFRLVLMLIAVVAIIFGIAVGMAIEAIIANPTGGQTSSMVFTGAQPSPTIFIEGGVVWIRSSSSI